MVLNKCKLTSNNTQQRDCENQAQGLQRSGAETKFLFVTFLFHIVISIIYIFFRTLFILKPLHPGAFFFTYFCLHEIFYKLFIKNLPISVRWEACVASDSVLIRRFYDGSLPSWPTNRPTACLHKKNNNNNNLYNYTNQKAPEKQSTM